MYYAPLVIAEALSSDDHVQVADLLLDGNSIHTPGYVIYEQGSPVRMLLINYMTDPTGAGNYTAQISVGATGGASSTPSSVRVKWATFTLCSFVTLILTATKISARSFGS